MESKKLAGSDWAVAGWWTVLVALVIGSWVANAIQSGARDEEQISRERLAAYEGREYVEEPARLILDRLEHDTPWLLYGLLIWITWLLQRVVGELRAVRLNLDNGSKSGTIGA